MKNKNLKMKFYIQKKKQNNNNSAIKNYSFILLFALITLVSTNKIINFKNSLHLLNFNYYHTTEVFIIID